MLVISLLKYCQNFFEVLVQSISGCSSHIMKVSQRGTTMVLIDTWSVNIMPEFRKALFEIVPLSPTGDLCALLLESNLPGPWPI